ncbi:MAG: hypothetical protein AAF348_19135, partial [Bacteroidota bacterium]
MLKLLRKLFKFLSTPEWDIKENKGVFEKLGDFARLYFINTFLSLLLGSIIHLAFPLKNNIVNDVLNDWNFIKVVVFGS